jgi:transcriptional regulator with XRE-family HTH domain
MRFGISKKVFGRRLQEHMLAKDWNQSELARRAGVGRDAISTYVRGQTYPTPKVLRKLCNALGITEAELLPADETVNSAEPERIVHVTHSFGSPGKTRIQLDCVLSYVAAADVLRRIWEDGDDPR